MISSILSPFSPFYHSTCISENNTCITENNTCITENNTCITETKHVSQKQNMYHRKQYMYHKNNTCITGNKTCITENKWNHLLYNIPLHIYKFMQSTIVHCCCSMCLKFHIQTLFVYNLILLCSVLHV